MKLKNFFNALWLSIAVFAINVEGYGQIVTEVAVETEFHDQSETAIAINPTDSEHLIATWNDFRSSPTYNPGYGVSQDGGVTWNQTGIITPDSVRIKGFDPSISFDGSGNAFYCYIASVYGLGDVAISRWLSGGVGWEDPAVIVHDNPLNEDDKPYIAVDKTGGVHDGNIYVSWTDCSIGMVIKFSYSTDGGNTFSPPFEIDSTPYEVPSIYSIPSTNQDDTTSNNPFVHGSMPAVAPNGDLYVMWVEVDYNANDSPARIKLKRSTDCGVTFGPTLITPDFHIADVTVGDLDVRSYLHASLAIDPSDGDLFVSYTEYLSDSIDLNICVRKSVDNGASWSDPIVPTQQTDEWQFFGWLSVDELGTVYLSYYEKIPAFPQSLIDVFVTRSIDGGDSFQHPDQKVTSVSSNPADAGWLHHYMGLTSYFGFAYPVWTDYRNGNADIYFAKIDYPPIAPKNLTLTSEEGHPRLRWDANGEPDLKEYHLYKELTINCFPCQVDTFVYVVTDTTYLDEGFDIGGRPPYDLVTYWVKAVDVTDQKSGPSNSRSTKGQSLIQWKQLVEQSIPEVYSLSHNYPNPFNPVTTIKYDLPEESFVELRIFNLLGEEIRTLVSGSELAGFKSILWDGKDNNANLVSSGMYIYHFSAKSLESDREFHQIKKMVLIR